MEQKRMLFAQAELRETRTRKRAQRPDYNYDFNEEVKNLDQLIEPLLIDGMFRMTGTTTCTRMTESLTTRVSPEGRADGSRQPRLERDGQVE